MKLQKWLSQFSSVLLVMALALAHPGLVTTALAQESTSDENIAYDPLTGALAFVGTGPGGGPIESGLVNASAQPEANAAAFATTYMNELGLVDVASELNMVKTVTKSGRSTVRYRQQYQGLPVFGSEVIVNTAGSAILSLTAKTSPNLSLNVNPKLTVAQATQAALKLVAATHHVSQSKLESTSATLQIYDSRLLHPDGVAPRLVWNLTVFDLADGVNEVVLVDAHTGTIALHYNQLDVITLPAERAFAMVETGPAPEVLGSPQIGIFDLNHASPIPSSPTGWPGTFVCNETNQTGCDGVGGDNPDATNAYKNANDIYKFMQNYLKIDSFDNAGVLQKGSIRYGNGYKKNFWVTGIHTAAYGEGYTGADDMAGHALGFGLLEHSGASGLFLAYQPGAIAESFSDMWGEFMDQTNARGTDTGAVKWLIGEDWPDGVQRSMSNPAAAPYNDADKMSSPNYYLGTDNAIGIYTNAGINNKAVFLMTDGGSFNGKTVKGLGIVKVAKIYYEVESHLLASASTYFDLYYAIKQACYNLMSNSQNGIMAQDCDQVRNALDAVQMNQTNSAAIFPVAPFCPASKSKGLPIFADSFENGTASWVISNSTSPSDLWTVVAEDATDGGFHLQASEAASPGKTVAETATAITIPSGHSIYLFFEHFFNFQTVSSVFRDGGVLYYSSDNGATWKNASTLFNGGQNYNGTIGTGHQNPVEGQQAFVGSTKNYVASTYNLTSLVGKQVKFRWIVASDDANGGTAQGWFLDNVQIYPCESLPSVPNLVSPAANALQTNFRPILDWSDAAPDVDHYVVQVGNDSAFTSIFYQAVSTVSNHKLNKSLLPSKKYYWRVRAYNAANDANGWSTARSLRTSLPAPTLVSPISGTASSLKPLYDWTNAAGAQGYTINVSSSSTFASLYINVTISTPTSQYQSTKSLVSGTTYFWRVRTTGTNGPSAWSVVKSFQAP